MEISDFVSIVIPAYNAEKYIIEAVESCLSQDYDNYEVIVVDDCSTDSTLQKLLRYKASIRKISKFNRLRIIRRKENGHTGAAMNTGIKAMRGVWFKEMQADDILLPNALHDMVKVARESKHKEDTIFYANWYRINHNGEITFRFPELYRNHLTPFQFNCVLLQHNIGNGITVLIHRSAFDKHGYFDEKTKHEDYEHRLRWCILQGARMELIEEFVAKYRVHDQSYTAKRSMTEMEEEDIAIKFVILSQLSAQQKTAYKNGILKTFPAHLYPNLHEDLTLMDILKAQNGIY